ncbi:disease resistance protein RPS2-like [Telopea speciosissima]|uniref:disease resistance protein RPS2-like n=1 Tax=Telopea speciosissima TaxID=54955 RepID=UPI001CC7D975|nr:disease resistance protein RPS2-like [Telopea speciosissima]
MDFIGPLVGVIDTYLIAPFVRQINYLRSSHDNVNGLQTVVQNLTAKMKDVETTLKAEENSGQVKTAVASNWFEAVDEIKEEAKVIEKEYSEGTCAGGWCVNCWSRYKMSKKSARLKVKAIVRLDEQFDVARPPSPKTVIEMPNEPIIENQPSTQGMLQLMLDCIGDPEIGIVGVYGMGGVGKTTLAKEVNNHFKNDPCFDTVIMVTVSATPNIRNIQTSISKRLGLPENSENDALFNALRKKKFLLILDDVWCELRLEDVGIPRPPNEKGSKILVTSRNQDICTDIGARKTVEVKPLSKAESWDLFVEKAGEHVSADGVKYFAEKIVGRCKGLPLAIVTVARAMANRRGVGVWENALREMKHLRGMIDKVFVPLKFSFDSLENDMLRNLFLYCASFPEDNNIEVDEMLNYCIGEGLVDELGSLKAARDNCMDLIESLKIACMLEDGEIKGSVRMHDIMRQLALWITSSEYSDSSSPKLLIRIGKSFKEAPQAPEWVDATMISLYDTQIEKLPELGETCQKLTTLLLMWNRILTVIPPTNFLQHVDHLSVLDLSFSEKLEYLPDSLSCLVKLRVLRLNSCQSLRSLPALGMLQQLQVLDLGWCSVLDQQILGSECVGGLSNLRYLNVEVSKVSIPTGVISHLHKLEELRFFRANKIKWCVSSAEDEKWDKKEERSGSSTSDSFIVDVRELSELTYLTSLSFSFEDIIISYWFKPLAKKITWLSLKRCRVIKQEALEDLNESQNLQYLTIEDCPGVKCVRISVGFTKLINCEDLEMVLDEEEEVYHHQNPFIGRRLDLRKLPKLKRICGSSITPLNCFGQLSWIGIEQCNSLKMVFTKGMPGLFNNLIHIRVYSCNRMEVIIEEAEEEEEEVNGARGVISTFPRLMTLELDNLPMLVDVCRNHILHCPLIVDVHVSKCPSLKKDPLHIQNANGLLVIEGERWLGDIKVMEDEIQAYSL